MSEYCVVVADAARARLFALEEGGVGEGGPNLVELSDLANPEGEAQGKELYSDQKSGRNEAPGGGGAHGFDDHRDRHVEELQRRFAKQIAAAAADTVLRQKPACLVVAAAPHMLGHLRDAIGESVAGLKIKEVGKDLCKLSAYELHEHLAADEVLPARQAAMT